VERLTIRGLRLFGHHGVRPEEREHGQLFFVDVRLELERPSAADELAETVDYTAVIEAIHEVNRSRRFRLLESFARTLASRLIEGFPRVRRAWVRVRKRPLWSGLDLEWVGAEAECERGGVEGG